MILPSRDTFHISMVITFWVPIMLKMSSQENHSQYDEVELNINWQTVQIIILFWNRRNWLLALSYLTTLDYVVNLT